MRHKKISFLGEFLIIIVIVLFVYLFLYQMNLNNINKISEINKKYGVTEKILLPTSNSGYISELSLVSENISKDLIEFVKLSEEISEIERMIFRASVVREDCASREMKLKINYINQNIDKLILEFKEKNNKKHNKLNVNSYITYLKNTKEKYFLYKTEIDRLDTC